MIDGVAFARHGVAALHQKPDTGQLQSVDPVLELPALAGELLFIEDEHRGRIGPAQVHVMQAEFLRILHDFNPRAPRILDESEFEQPRDVAGLFKLGFVEDPWGTRIEVVQDPEKLGLHHVHLRGPDPAAVLVFYKEKLAGESGKLKDRIDGLKLTGVWLLVQRGDAVPSEGHAIDHIGFRVTDLAAKTGELKAQSVKFTTEPRPLKLASGVMVNYAYIEGPAGAKVELVQR